MKTLIVCVSVSNGNTAKVARAFADELGAEVVEPEKVDASKLADYDLIGVGSGIYGMMFHPRLWRFVRGLPQMKKGARAFVFATSGGPAAGWWFSREAMVRALRRRGLDVAGVFSCRGYDTWLPLRMIGGLNRGRPNDADLNAARAFARGLQQ